MELHMAGGGSYNVEVAAASGGAGGALLVGLVSGETKKRGTGRMVFVVGEIALPGASTEQENVHLTSTTPNLHSVKVGGCAAFYAYASMNGRIAVFLLGFYPAQIYLRQVGTAASRLSNLP